MRLSMVIAAVEIVFILTAMAARPSPATNGGLAGGSAKGDRRISNSWWALILITAVVLFMVVTTVIFTGAEILCARAGHGGSCGTGAPEAIAKKIKMRGVLVGYLAGCGWASRERPCSSSSTRTR